LAKAHLRLIVAIRAKKKPQGSGPVWLSHAVSALSARIERMDNIDDGAPQGKLPPEEQEIEKIAKVIRLAFSNPKAVATKPAVVQPPKSPQLSEDELALIFSERYGEYWRHVSEWGQWWSWSGERWEAEKTRLVFEKAREICRELKASRRLKTAQSIETLARGDRRIAAKVEQWDADLWLLNTAGGTVDLRTGQMRQHSPQDYCTKLTSVSPSQEECPRFMRFLNEIFDGNEELIRYLQKVFGYCLTGETREQQLWFFYGTGSNGKSVLLSTISGILGDYAMTAPIETFTSSNHNEHPTELARLKGSRLVTANETEEGRRWAEAKIKQLTGGDEISARLMRQDYFTFKPQFKLTVAGNHKPSLRTVDEAMRRRMNLVPFAVTIPEGKRDPNLLEALKLEWPGILAWMIEGCLAWQAEGLTPPVIVRQATDEYLADEDAIAEWIEECCDIGANHKCGSAALYKSWKDWSELHGEYTGSQKQFTAKLRGRGLQDMRQKAGKFFTGVDLIQKQEQSTWQY
jgi:putative DNA primase/helicase